MSKMLFIGITQRVEKVNSYNECRDVLDQKLIDWVVQAGFLPVPIPNNLVDINSSDNQSKMNYWLQNINIHGIVLSGGNDIGIIKERDLTEKYLLSWAEKNKEPVLGICRGMQMMGVYSGGHLIKVDGHVRTRHEIIRSNKNTDSSPRVVNSYHNLALENCPKKFDVLAQSEDGHLEAMRHKKLPWEGWMWHPEREEIFCEIDQEDFKMVMNNEI